MPLPLVQCSTERPRSPCEQAVEAPEASDRVLKKVVGGSEHTINAFDTNAVDDIESIVVSHILPGIRAVTVVIGTIDLV